MEKKKKKKENDSEDHKLIAKKDFHIFCDEMNRKIKKGDDLSDLPNKLLNNMYAEGVL